MKIILKMFAVGNQLYEFKIGIRNKTSKTLERVYKMIGHGEIWIELDSIDSEER